VINPIDSAAAAAVFSVLASKSPSASSRFSMLKALQRATTCRFDRLYEI